jgi:hypothetical protein
VNRNILKGELYSFSLKVVCLFCVSDSKVAPALQAAQDKLQRSQLEDKLDKALENRPKPEELVNNGILNSRFYTIETSLGLTAGSEDEVPPSH